MLETNTGASDQINKFTSNYLTENLEVDFYASDFSQKYFETLLQSLFENFGKEKTQSRMKTIRTCIMSHFSKSGQECEVNISAGKIKVVNKLKPGIQSAELNKASISLGLSMQILIKNKDDYSLQENLLCYPQDVLNDLYSKFSHTSIHEDKQELRNTIRANVSNDFELDNRDIVLFLRKKLYIRYFIKAKKAEGDSNRRFEGMDPQYLETLYQDNFPENFSEILLDMAPEVISDALDFSRIDNFAFKEKYIEVFKTLVDVAMQEYVSSIEKESIIALNGYILRLHFDSLLFICAEILIDMVMKRNRKADEFLRFYNGETLVDVKGKNIKKPLIVDDKGNRWNYNSIFSIMTQGMQYAAQYENQVKAIEEAQSQYQKAKEELGSAKSQVNESEQRLSLVKDELTACTLVKDSLIEIISPSEEEKKSLQVKRAEEKRLLLKHDELFSKNREKSLKHESAKVLEKSRFKQVEVGKATLGSMEKKAKELEQQQVDILTALAKALIFR